MLLLAALIIITRTHSFAQHDPIEHIWYNEEKTAKVQIYKAVDGKFYGKVVWLKEPNRDGKPKLDIHNSDKKRQCDPLMGMVVLKQFKKKDATHYEDGTIYDPKIGKTYTSKMELKNGKLEVRGYIGISIIGRSATWTKAD
jgi:uncharacterized protein (DUF2147 family)